jgi:hypothetical protein
VTNYHHVRFHGSRRIPVKKAVAAVFVMEYDRRVFEIKALSVESYLPKLFAKNPKTVEFVEKP